MIELIVGLGGYTCIDPTAGLIKPTTWTDEVSLVDSFTEGFVPARKLTTVEFLDVSPFDDPPDLAFAHYRLSHRSPVVYL